MPPRARAFAAPAEDAENGAREVLMTGAIPHVTHEVVNQVPLLTRDVADDPPLRHEPALASRFAPLLASRTYDPGLRAPDGKAGLLAGMAMTEKQGGSDVRANTTRAVPAGSDGYLLTGHKWFCSAPMCDLFLVLAQAPEGLTCFLLPRGLPDGSSNAIRLQWLKGN